jgi:hypothetical protein
MYVSSTLVTHVVLVYQIFGITIAIDSLLEDQPITSSRILWKIGGGIIIFGQSMN